MKTILCISVGTWDTLEGVEYWRPLDTIFWEYKNHKELKFEGNIGELKRRHLQVDSIIHIGKETNNLEETEVVGVQKDDYQIYQNEKVRDEKLKERIMALTLKTAEKYGISKRQLYRWKKKIREGQDLKLYRKMRERMEKLFQVLGD